ncbi:16S rRNA (cytidine(1402)-2'-O)-methyltransferase [Terriglobus aquaticus]|uniref:Ribosomal RNA small subunit methyltransferase I n=1 Tax=Terriglobus aquaticus TaxID=940139 RepID=A0ABW9KPG4_9BACT|nr:16S rRNA (cytidine(1402)-2'-O)-methyltransferase [Terriglobus aquaticus]
MAEDSLSRPGIAPTEPLAPGLYLVPTPIGNLRDITLRALDVLERCDVIACEDTRETQKLLNHFGIETPTVSHHLHNERDRADELVRRVLAGERIALVSDAGMPAIADPGETAVSLAVAAGVPVYALPGANAAVTALVASGLPAERFSFRGFLPSKSGERRSALEALHRELQSLEGVAGTQIFYETPHRIVEALTDVVAVFGAAHPVALARELTKLHEEFLRGTAADVLRALEAKDRVRGEMVLLLAGTLSAEENAGSESLAAAVRRVMREEGLDEMAALKRVARERGLGKSEAYREWQRTKGR